MPTGKLGLGELSSNLDTLPAPVITAADGKKYTVSNVMQLKDSGFDFGNEVEFDVNAQGKAVNIRLFKKSGAAGPR